MRVLCTGAAGFVGSHVVDLLLANGHRVWCIDNLSTGKRENIPEGVEFCKMDITNWYDLLSECCDCEPEAVIHLAAQPSISGSWDQPIWDSMVNVIGTLNVIQASKKIGAKRLVFASTSAVYDDANFDEDGSARFHEEWIKKPTNPYGISKLAAESHIRILLPADSVVLRFGNVYGPRQVPLGENQVIPHMIRHFEYGDPFFIHGNGNQKRDMIYVEDVARACLLALDGTRGIYNIASGSSVSVNNLAKAVAELYEVPDYPWEHDDQQDTRRKIEMNIDLANLVLGWKPETGLITGLERTIQWWKKQKTE